MAFHLDSTPLKDVCVVTSDAFEDERGYFTEAYRADRFRELSLPSDFPQDNQSHSKKNVIRGLHFQWEPAMGKLMRVISGSAFLVAVDIRKGSPTLGRWFGLTLSAGDQKQVWAPAGFARGFAVLSDYADVLYKCTAIYNSRGESGIRWDDPEIGIKWPVKDPILSEKDQRAPTLAEWLRRPESDRFQHSEP